MKNPSYFLVELSNDYNVTDKPEPEGWTPKFTEKQLEQVFALCFDSEISMEDNYSNLEQIIEDGVAYEYSIKLGAFTEWENEYTLEQTFDTMQEIYNDLKNFCMEEKIDFIYRPYVLVKLQEPSSDGQYDTLEEKYL